MLNTAHIAKDPACAMIIHSRQSKTQALHQYQADRQGVIGNVFLCAAERERGGEKTVNADMGFNKQDAVTLGAKVELSEIKAALNTQMRY